MPKTNDRIMDKAFESLCKSLSINGPSATLDLLVRTSGDEVADKLLCILPSLLSMKTFFEKIPTFRPPRRRIKRRRLKGTR